MPLGADTATSGPLALSGLGRADAKPAKRVAAPMIGAKKTIVVDVRK